MRIVLLLISILAVHAISSAATPELLFSDLDSGPKTGWNGGSDKGCAVSIWGLNFGAAGASSKVTVAGVDILSTNSTMIVEWNVAGIARALKRITFFVPTAAGDGAQTISVTNADGTSSTIPFTVRSGDIYYVDPTDGDDGNNGTTTDSAFETILNCIDTGGAGSTCYLKEDTYTETNATDHHVRFDNQAGSSGNPIAIVSYPGETATIGNGTLNSGFGQYNSVGHGDNHDITIAKLDFDVQQIGVGSAQSETPWYNFRVIANNIQDATEVSWAGAIYFAYAYDVKIFGNRINNCGGDKYDHSIYLNSHPSSESNLDSHDIEIAWNEISNQNSGSNIKVHPKDSSTDAIWDEVYIHSNYIHDSDNEAFEFGARLGDVYFYNNLIVNVPDGGGSYPGTYPVIHFTNQDGTSANMRIWNNTFVDTSQAASAWIDSVDGSGCTVSFKNNIIYATSTFTHDAGSWDGTISGDHNVLYNIDSIAAWDTSTLNSDDPVFNVGGYYTIQESSPAVDAGDDTSAVVTDDYYGGARDGSIDIGFHEFGAGGGAPTFAGMTLGAGGATLSLGSGGLITLE